MDREVLISTAKEIKQVSPETAIEYYNSIDKISSEVSRIMLSRKDISSLIGSDNYDMMKDNHANHARFISAQLQNFNPEVLVNTILWVFRAYRSRGFSTNYWAAQLNCWVTVLKHELTENCFEETLPLYNWMIINIPNFTRLTEENPDNQKMPQ